MEQITLLVAFYLDKLKVSNPLVYLLIQLSSVVFLLLFTTNKLSINEEVDRFITVVLGTLLVGVSPRTSSKAKEYNDNRHNDQFPPIDQSNN